MADEQLDYGDEEFGGSQKMQYHGDGAIPALADDEIGGEDDEYDDLYNDVNVGEGFLQMQRSEALPTSNVGNGGFHDQKANVPEARPEPMASQNINIPGVAAESAYQRVPDNKDGMTVDLMQKRMAPQVTNDVQAASMGFRGSIPVPQNPAVDPVSMPGTMTNEPAPMLNSNSGHPVGGVSQMPGNQMGANANVNMARPMVNENQARPPADNGATTLFVGELHWWTTDAELENVLSQYGRVKEIKFFDERASGKSKGYCQVDFYESGSAAACKDGMNGYVFNGRPCVVAFASPQTMRQMGASYANKNQGPAQSQPELQGRRPMNDGAGRGGGTNFSGGDAGRGGRGNWGGRGQQGGVNRGGVHMRGRGGMGPKNANTPGFGGPAGGPYGQGLGGGPGFGGPPGGFMHPQGMMGGGFDPTYMGRGAGYGGFPGSGFPGMMPQFPGVNPMGIAGVAPHVNPAFFNRGMGAGGMGMMGNSGMEGPQAGMWGDTSMGGWGEEQGQRTRESSYGGEDGASEYGYGEASHDKAPRSNAVSREKERGSEREWSGNSEKKHRDERDQDRDRDRYEKDYKYKEEKDHYREHRQKDRSAGYEDDWDRGQSSTRSRSRSRAVPEEDHRSRSRDADYGKRRRMRSD
ncbi:Nucleotide-binding, alpha-beta plait [Artemisia annua]|uniref:Nucleotide-binding, alpha-beta plait n=1 Tax=Artemisia annua TaxID=35608 RepID=A0A2U1QI84_ARTAN|nr:Nucleotide-binding, alpha-beta plait [Artemisia annua]